MTENNKLTCDRCGAENPASHNYCGACGNPLARDARPVAPEPEIRQLTVLFCDLVGSTALSDRLDPEVLTELLRAYQSTATKWIHHFGGTVSRYMGDGILTLFGYPTAYEDAPERAVRAALATVDAIRTTDFAVAGERIRVGVRIGVATGVVVAGDLVGEGASEEEAVIGQAPNLAARAQAVAATNEVVIADSTRSLLGSICECEDLGAHELKGFSHPIRLWRAMRVREEEHLDINVRASSSLMVINRDEEREHLRHCWQAAAAGQGNIVYIGAEPGMGKSRLVHELTTTIGNRHETRMVLACSRFHRNVAFHPVLVQLQRQLDLRTDDDEWLVRRKLARVTGALGEGATEFTEAYVRLSQTDQAGSQWIADPEAIGRHAFREGWTRLVLARSQQMRLCLVVEDHHWIDPSTDELLSELAASISKEPLLIVVTSRVADSKPEWLDESRDRVLRLTHLSAGHTRELVSRTFTAEEPPADALIDLLVRRSDGVPLFAEELARLTASGHHTPEDIPDTLRDILLARLDQVPAARRVVQTAAVIGREFDRELLDRVHRGDDAILADVLGDLTESGVLAVQAHGNNSTYVFRHALLWEAAYATLLRARRIELHAAVADALSEADYPAPVPAHRIAHHDSRAERFERSAHGWYLAGMAEASRAANLEAARFLEMSLADLARTPPGPERDRLELAVRTGLGVVRMAVDGPGAPEVEEHLRRAVALTDVVTVSEDHFAAWWNWWRIAPSAWEMHERASRLHEIAAEVGDPDLLMQAHHCQWATSYNCGHLETFHAHVEAGLALYDVNRHRHHAAIYGGHDARVCALGESGLVLWLTGRCEEAWESLHAALQWAAEFEHAGSSYQALDTAILLAYFDNRYDRVLHYAEEIATLAQAEDYVDYRIRSEVFACWARGVTERNPRHTETAAEKIDRHRKTGTTEDLPLFLTMLAELHHQAQDYPRALACAEEAAQLAQDSGFVFWMVETLRWQAVVHSLLGHATRGRETFWRASTLAEEQGARTLQLRLAFSDLELSISGRAMSEVRSDLAALAARFPDDVSFPDLEIARRAAHEC